MFGWFKRKTKPAEISRNESNAMPRPPVAQHRAAVPADHAFAAAEGSAKEAMSVLSGRNRQPEPSPAGAELRGVPKVGDTAFHLQRGRNYRMKVIAVQRNGSRIIAKQLKTDRMFTYDKRADGSYGAVGSPGRSGASLRFADIRLSSTGRAGVGKLGRPAPVVGPSPLADRRGRCGSPRPLRPAARFSVRKMKLDRVANRARPSLHAQ